MGKVVVYLRTGSRFFPHCASVLNGKYALSLFKKNSHKLNDKLFCQIKLEQSILVTTVQQCGR